jgi:uncharacterized phage infection (PIP) family protein YhgE
MESISSDLKKLMKQDMIDELIQVETIAISPLYEILLNKKYTTPVGKTDYITAYT